VLTEDGAGLVQPLSKESACNQPPILAAFVEQARSNSSSSNQLKRSGRGAVSVGALILKLNDEGEVKAWPHRAQLVLVDFFDCQSGGYWAPPQTLLEWIKTQFERARLSNVTSSAFAPLVVRLAAKRLTVRFFYTPGKPAYLTFEETADSATDPTRYSAIGLTPRQSEILTWVAQGKRDWEIAQIIHASTRTVSNHVYRILQRLRVETRTAAVAEAEFRLRRQS
jgi:DNA-binding CsgD family transcriptional regulator